MLLTFQLLYLKLILSQIKMFGSLMSEFLYVLNISNHFTSHCCFMYQANNFGPLMFEILVVDCDKRHLYYYIQNNSSNCKLSYKLIECKLSYLLANDQGRMQRRFGNDRLILKCTQSK